MPTWDQTAQTTARALRRTHIQPFGCPERMLSDQGAGFESATIRQLCKLYGCTKSRTSPYHPQGNGTCERFNQTLLSVLSTLEEERQPRWNEILPEVIYAYNNKVHSIINLNPFFVMVGRHARLLVDLGMGALVERQQGTVDQRVNAHHRVLSRAYKEVGMYAGIPAGKGQAPLQPADTRLIVQFLLAGKREIDSTLGSQPLYGNRACTCR